MFMRPPFKQPWLPQLPVAGAEAIVRLAASVCRQGWPTASVLERSAAYPRRPARCEWPAAAVPDSSAANPPGPRCCHQRATGDLRCARDGRAVGRAEKAFKSRPAAVREGDKALAATTGARLLASKRASVSYVWPRDEGPGHLVVQPVAPSGLSAPSPGLLA